MSKNSLKEYGGYLSIELPIHEELYSDCKYRGIQRLNSGRSAIKYALNDFFQGEKGTVWLPYYMCPSVRESLSEYNIRLYHLDESFLPTEIDNKDNDIIIWANYFGIQRFEKVENLLERFNNIIFDNTQAFFQKPIENQYNIYSCRKFFGVADGAYVVKQNLKKEKMEKDISFTTSNFLLKAIETGTNGAYHDSIINEERLEMSNSVLEMSDLTRRILCSIDYEKIAAIRRDNFRRLHQRLHHCNKYSFDYNDIDVPMVYPFVYEKNNLRENLLKSKIYIPQWWKYLLSDEKANEFEKMLSQYLLPLPIDQRYRESDMDVIADIIIENI